AQMIRHLQLKRMMAFRQHLLRRFVADARHPRNAAFVVANWRTREIEPTPGRTAVSNRIDRKILEEARFAAEGPHDARLHGGPELDPGVLHGRAKRTGVL